MKHRILILPILLALAPPAARAAEKTVPETASLLDRVLRANTQLSPMTITMADVQRRPDRPELTIQSTIQWNDPDHYRVTSTGAGNLMIGVANGASRILYTSSDNTFERNGKHSQMVAPVLQAGLATLTSSLSDPKERATFAKGVVTSTTLDGESVYRIYVAPHPGDKSAYFAMLVDQSDLLIRKFVLNKNASRSDTMTLSYHKEAAPFPAGTFTLTPPAGAHEAAE